MLEANKNIWFEKAFAVYNRNLLNRRFHSLQISGLDILNTRNSKVPFVIYANHSSWWDGLIAFQISRAARLDSYFMMEEKHLRKLQLFRRLGAFSVIREKPRQAMKSIDYAAGILREIPNRAVWIFPQGEILPNDVRPIRFFNGLTKVIEKTGICRAAPVAFRYEFLGDYKPDVFVKIGKPENFDLDNALNKNAKFIFENSLTKTLDALKEAVVERNFQHFENLL